MEVVLIMKVVFFVILLFGNGIEKFFSIDLIAVSEIIWSGVYWFLGGEEVLVSEVNSYYFVKINKEKILVFYLILILCNYNFRFFEYLVDMIYGVKCFL